jgi:hypothetical protein
VRCYTLNVLITYVIPGRVVTDNTVHFLQPSGVGIECKGDGDGVHRSNRNFIGCSEQWLTQTCRTERCERLFIVTMKYIRLGSSM